MYGIHGMWAKQGILQLIMYYKEREYSTKGALSNINVRVIIHI
jgi:hypothetical protein